MKNRIFIVLTRKNVSRAVFFLLAGFVFAVLMVICHEHHSASAFVDPQNGIIVIDPGHGGIDGGANIDGYLEKDTNLAIAKKLKTLLEIRGLQVIMTRSEDVSLDSLNQSSRSRHQRDLNARVNIINNSNAQLFVSIHVNSNFNRPSTDGSIVLYGKKYPQSKTLAECIQKELNNITVDGEKRTEHGTVQADFFILTQGNMPGVIVETGFISNDRERQLLWDEPFRDRIAEEIAEGIDRYLYEPDMVLIPNRKNDSSWLPSNQ